MMPRVLAALLVAAALALTALQRLSPFAAAVRERRPSLAWLALPSGLHLALYHPVRRTLDLVFVPDETLLGPRRTLAVVRAEALKTGADPDAAAAAATARKLAPLVPSWTDWDALPLLRARPPAAAPGNEPVSAAEWVASWAQGPRFWRAALRPPRRFDDLLLALELHRLPAGAIRPAWLPADDAAPAFFGRLLSSREPEAETRPLTVEVLNATGKPGLASQAKKILRLRGADVMQTDNAGSSAARTIVYDRTGRFENASAVHALLGCGAAAAATRIDHKRLVDVTVVLAEDCPIE